MQPAVSSVAPYRLAATPRAFDPDLSIRFCPNCGFEPGDDCQECRQPRALPRCRWPTLLASVHVADRLEDGLVTLLAPCPDGEKTDILALLRMLLRAPAEERRDRSWQRSLFAVAIVAAAEQQDPRKQRALLEAGLQHLIERDLHWAFRRVIACAAHPYCELDARSWYQVDDGALLLSADPLVMATCKGDPSGAAQAIRTMALTQVELALQTVLDQRHGGGATTCLTLISLLPISPALLLLGVSVANWFGGWTTLISILVATLVWVVRARVTRTKEETRRCAASAELNRAQQAAAKAYALDRAAFLSARAGKELSG